MSFMNDLQAHAGFATDKAHEITELLSLHAQQNAQVIERLDGLLEQDTFVRRAAAGVVQADGTVEVSIIARPGFLMKLHSLAVSQVTAGSGFVAFYFDSTSDGQNLVYANSGAILLSDAFPDGTILQENATLIARFTGLTSGDRVTVAVNASRMPLYQAVSVPGVPY